VADLDVDIRGYRRVFCHHSTPAMAHETVGRLRLGQGALSVLLRSTLNELSLSTEPKVLVAAAAVSSLGLFALNSALDVGLNWAWASAGQRMVYDLAADLFHRLHACRCCSTISAP
jgi:hypothetical protein